MRRAMTLYGLKRRFLFGFILLAAAIIASVMATRFSAPAVQYDYLSDALEIKEKPLTTVWTESDISNGNLLSERDKKEFLALVRVSDRDGSIEAGYAQIERPLLIGQAEGISNHSSCSETEPFCNVSIFLKREITPNYVHGDLRLVSLIETAIRQDVTIDQRNGAITTQNRFEQKRQLRFMLTQRGWVMRTNEIKSEEKLAPTNQADVTAKRFSGLNYYPSSAPWDLFWSNYPREVIAADLKLINEMGANSVRIFVNHDYFSDPATKTTALNRLQDFLDMCAARKIAVIVTLFDLRSDYRFSNWSADALHVGEVLSVAAGHPALLAVDLKNQADLDFSSQGEPLVQAWLEAMAFSVKQYASQVPVTVGWSDASHADKLVDLVDLVSYHDYKSPQGFAERFQNVQSLVGDKPVFLTEIGSSRWSLASFGEGSPMAQANRLQNQLDQLDGAQGVFVWTLHDFQKVPTNIVGHRPWRRDQQKIFGIVDAAGNPLPSGEVFRKFNTNFLSDNDSSLEISQ